MDYSGARLGGIDATSIHMDEMFSSMVLSGLRQLRVDLVSEAACDTA